MFHYEFGLEMLLPDIAQDLPIAVACCTSHTDTASASLDPVNPSKGGAGTTSQVARQNPTDSPWPRCFDRRYTIASKGEHRGLVEL